MDTSDSGILFLSRKEKNINFRTAAHNHSIRADDQYDAKYHCTALLHSKLWALYNTVLSSLTAPLIRQLLKCFRTAQLAKVTKTRRVFVALSGWSATDRRQAVGRIASSLQAEAMVVQCNDYSSCAEILDEIRGGLALYDDRIVAREVKRARAAKSNIADGVVIPIATAIETAVLSHQYDAESMLGRDKTNPCLVIIFNSSEKMPASVFGTLLESLADVVSVRLFFVMDHSSACPLPTLVEGGQRCRFDAELAEVPSTLELADSVMLSLLSTHILPVYLPRSVLTTLHLAFDDGDRCVYWLVSRLCMYVTVHFRQRQAILCVSGEHKLMTELKFLNGKFKSSALKQKKAIQSILPYLSLHDLKDTGLMQHTEEGQPLGAPSDNDTFNALHQLDNRIRIDRALLKFLHVIRNLVLPPTEIFNWRVGSIWIDIQTVGCMADRASTISRMCEVIKNYLQNCSITTLSLILSEWKLIFSRSNFELGSSGDPEDMCDIDPDTLAVVDKICGTAESLECVLGDIINIKLQEDLSKTYCITALDSLRSICRKLEHLSSDTLPEGAVISTTCPLRLDDLLACFADDFYESICSTIVEVVAISRPRDLSGVATLSDSCCGLGNSLINVNSRKMFSLSLQSPYLYLRHATDAIAPDVCTLFCSLQNFGKGGSMTGLFDDFYLLASTWDTSSTEKMAQIEELKKRHGRKAATSIDTSMCKDHLKSRFLDAVYGLQKASLIKVTNNGKSFQKIVSTWVYDNLE